jgi:hypothetical protein
MLMGEFRKLTAHAPDDAELVIDGANDAEFDISKVNVCIHEEWFASVVWLKPAQQLADAGQGGRDACQPLR